MVKSSAKSERMLFQRPDGTPYDFWIQSNCPQMTRDILSKQIEEHGGRVTEFGEFPDHGFLLLDAMDPSPLYEVKTAFHKPVQRGGGAYERIKNVNATPLRHVVSFRFVSAAIEQDGWDRYDLLRWGFPVSLPLEDTINPKAAIERYQKEIALGIDAKMEQGWIWASGRAFDSYDPAYRFSEEFKILDQAIESNDPVRNSKKYKIWLRGRVVAGCRLKWQVKFYLHNDIKKEDQERLITAIMENGGATCYDSTEADVILIGCEVDEIEDDLDAIDWITKNPRKVLDNDTRTLVKFTPWVQHCIEAGDWKLVDPKTEDVARAHRLFQKKKRLTAEQKGKGRATLVEVNLAGRKRKRNSNGNVMESDEQGSPTKKRKQQPDETVGTTKSSSNSKSGRHLPSSLSLGTAPGTGSTVRPRRVFESAAVLGPQPSPLKHDGNTSSLVLGQKSKSRQELTATQPVGDKEQEDVIIASAPEDPLSIIFDPHQHSRASAASVLTVDTATSSKVNTTTNTTTTGTSKSARSVGPSFPPKSQQIGRPSTSTGVDTEPSVASRDVREQSLALSRRKARQRPMPDFQANFDADDLAGEVILTSFSSGQLPKDASNLAVRPTKASPAGQPLTEFEESLVLCWRRMSELQYRDGVVLIEDLMSRWPDLEQELQRKATLLRGRKGKGRVSFHEPVKDVDEDQDFVLETDYDEGGAKQSVFKSGSIKKSFNLRAYSRDRYGSKTPDSVVSSDEDGSMGQELRPGSTASPANPAAAGTPSRSPIGPRSSTLKKASSRNPSRASRLSPRGVTKPTKSSRVQSVTSTPDKGAKENKGDQEEIIQDEEENEEVAPLPPAKTRSQRRRADSVASGNESAEESRPRRGRSASAAPQERLSTRAPMLPRMAAPADSVGRKYATKSTGGKPPLRKK